MNCELEKKSLNNFICHLSFLKKTFPPLIHIPSYPIVQILKTLWVVIFWVWVIHKRLNVNWTKIDSIIFSVTCHGLENFASTHTHPLISIHEFSKPYRLIIFWIWVISKWLNANWEKIDSIILSVICHSLRKFPLIIHHPPISIHEFLKPWQVIISWVWVICKILNMKWKKNHPIILSVNCHCFRTSFPPLIHSPSYLFVNFQKTYKWGGWVMKGGVDHTGVGGVRRVIQRCGGSCWGGVGHVGA